MASADKSLDWLAGQINPQHTAGSGCTGIVTPLNLRGYQGITEQGALGCIVEFHTPISSIHLEDYTPDGLAPDFNAETLKQWHKAIADLRWLIEHNQLPRDEHQRLISPAPDMLVFDPPTDFIYATPTIALERLRELFSGLHRGILRQPSRGGSGLNDEQASNVALLTLRARYLHLHFIEDWHGSHIWRSDEGLVALHTSTEERSPGEIADLALRLNELRKKTDAATIYSVASIPSAQALTEELIARLMRIDVTLVPASTTDELRHELGQS